MKDKYENPLITRYASKEMAQIFSPTMKYRLWRELWIALAEAQKELGLNISEEQLDEMKRNKEKIDFELASKKEKEFRHDVMAHVHTFGAQCPKAKPIIHLGATSAFVGDNTDLILMYKAMNLIKVKLINLIDKIRKFALKYKDVPTLGFTHFQPAQLTTIGKRAALWLHDLYLDYENLEYRINNIKLRGAKGTTGTQASYLKLFDNDHEKVKKLDKLVAYKLGFNSTYPVTGQTYSRKIDFEVLSVLSGIAQTLHKITNDIRLLQHLKEIEEPFEKKQIGSSAMAYKRNPMRSERIASLARYIISNLNSAAMTASTQWFERTLDDSANRRLIIPQSFLACDAILEIAINVFSGLVVYEEVIKSHIESELPFMATENIIMMAVKKGGDRQELHEVIRQLSMEASKVVKEQGGKNDLIDRIINCDKINLTKEEILDILDPEKFIGRAPEQVVEFIEEYIDPILNKHKDVLGLNVELNV
ncbi:adenylosuccinate lyase [Caloranaerobacter azorensis DSM 13643]|uniref:Adenylosuccinate lyase n=1 Tax=Caloranaerobacter azorensis DSM 13643 TaxID=1121264 RepID=A0A1M5WC49_9FIRM|nr:adenylosuccinate lyase [Caloranaerobacter azorensis]SHH84774.1 adenylosuccinate lyase [Caloranaerobacter azorensis DSM 13643]